MEQWSSPAEELEALRTSAARARCVVRYAAEKDTPHGRRSIARVVCPDGWAAARLLTALAVEDAMTASARAIALDLRRDFPSDAEFAEAVFEYVKDRVKFVREPGEVFARSDYTLAAGAGDCDDHARVVYAILRAGGAPARLAFLYRRGDRGPRHVVAQALVRGTWMWLETTVDAFFGEPPYVAARRLGLLGARPDISTEVRTMTEKDLAPLPIGFDAHTAPEQLQRDVTALEQLGYLSDCVAPNSPSSPGFRRAVAAFQRAAHLQVDGLIGPVTRGAIAHALPPDEFGMGYLGALPSSTPLTSHLSDGFFRAVRAMGARSRAKGATYTDEDFLKVLLAESGIRNIPNGQGYPYAGLNQMGHQERKSAGFAQFDNDAAWLALTPESQMPYVERFFINAVGGNFRLLRDASSLYLVNFMPAFIAHAGDPSFVLARRNPNGPEASAPESEWAAWRNAVDENGKQLHRGDTYAANRGFDRQRKGTIVVADLGVAVEGATGGKNAPYWAEVRMRLGSVPASSAGPGGVAGTVLGVLGLLLVVATAGAAWNLAGES